MSRLHASFRLGYHGCSEEAGKAILASKEMLPSRKSYNWLCSGRYFWDADPVRAWQWADENAGSGEAPYSGTIRPQLRGRSGIESSGLGWFQRIEVGERGIL